MEPEFVVRNNRRALKIIPYIGCKSGFSHIFDSLIPDECAGGRIYDVFGGGGGFSFYACARFGSQNVVYNDHNPVITNLMEALKSDPGGLWTEYQAHRRRSSADYYLRVRKMDIGEGLAGAGRFFYLAKNAFSGKIRFNSKNEFNAPMRKRSACPDVSIDLLRSLSSTIKDLTITCKDFAEYGRTTGGFVYLDPPYMNNPNGHYNAIVQLGAFMSFVKGIEGSNRVMISEHNDPETLGLSGSYRVYRIRLGRSLQYFTQNDSNEIIAINYGIPAAAVHPVGRQAAAGAAGARGMSE